MAKAPPTAIRYLVLIAAVSLLGLAVCSKTQKAQEPASAPAALSEPQPLETGAEDSGLDAGAEAPADQAQQQAPNPPVNAVDKGNTVKPDEEFFPATKSGGMF